MSARPRLGLAFSGGGFRATSFGLGCLRALHDRGLLGNAVVMSGISGGSLLVALYAYGPPKFEDFDALVKQQLRKGLQLEILARALRPAALVRNLGQTAKSMLLPRSSVQRKSNRTDALRDALARRVFGDRTMGDVTHPGLTTVITATDLRTSNAVRFGSRVSACSAFGVIDDLIPVSEAVAASAAFPLLLPAMERRYAFRRHPDAEPEQIQVSLTDGGVYDNLGLTVLEPGRSPEHTAHSYDVDYVIACDAGRGRLPMFSGHFAASRVRRSFDITHRRAQDAGRSKLHAAEAAGLIRGFVLAYLGMRDDRLQFPVKGLVPAETVMGYPTDFRAMTSRDLDALTLRGEQLTRVLLSHYCPDL